jgi:hypothetical protein
MRPAPNVRNAWEAFTKDLHWNHLLTALLGEDAGTAWNAGGFIAVWRVTLVLALLAACSSGSSDDLQYVKQARSLGAEWALVNEQAGQDKLTPTYVGSMHVWLRRQLQASLTSLTQPRSRYGEEIEALTHEPDNAPPEKLRAHVEKLKAIEDQLESA